MCLSPILILLLTHLSFNYTYRNAILWPIFIFFLIVFWIFALVFLVTSISGADFCVKPGKPAFVLFYLVNACVQYKVLTSWLTHLNLVSVYLCLLPLQTSCLTNVIISSLSSYKMCNAHLPDDIVINLLYRLEEQFHSVIFKYLIYYVSACTIKPTGGEYLIYVWKLSAVCNVLYVF